MTDSGFLGTGSPLYMDLFILLTSLIPFLILFSVWQASQEHYRVHRLMQGLLFGLAFGGFMMVGYYLYFSVSFWSNLEAQGAGVWYLFCLYVGSYLLMLMVWFATLKYAHGDHKRRALPGLYSKGHKRLGRWVFGWIVFNTLLGWLLYGGFHVH